MLVDHDVEADLVAQRELVEIAVQQSMPDLRIVIAIGQYDPQRAALQPFFPGRMIGHLREVPDAHGSLLLLSRLCPRRPLAARRTFRAVPNAGSDRPVE